MWFSKDYIFQIYGLYSVGIEKGRMELHSAKSQDKAFAPGSPMNYVEQVSPATKVTKYPNIPKNARNAPNFDYLDPGHINPYPTYKSPKFAPFCPKNNK